MGLKEEAKQCIPIQQLHSNTQSRLDMLKLNQNHYRDILILELLKWFKVVFFKWIDQPLCECQRKTTRAGNVTPTVEELHFGANRVENYWCSHCSKFIRFPRYNDPKKLLQTRSGRCGEWANCFTLCCRALDYEARFVLDWTDHVWTEIYSEQQQRWLHCDPCENVCDKPLLYESGWGKKLTYVIGFSLYDIQDVTWRYTAHHEDVVKRRNECDEKWLAKTLTTLRRKRQRNLEPIMKMQLEQRNILELIAMLTVNPTVSVQELPGRTTGSYEWRLARGELPITDQQKDFNSVSIIPTCLEIEKKIIEVMYDCSKDHYIRTFNNHEIINSWKSLISNCVNIGRQEEYDWNKVYLSRLPGSILGLIQWKVDLSSFNYKIGVIELKVQSSCFENGIVLWEISSNEDRICKKVVQVKPDVSHNIEDFHGAQVIFLTATLIGGNGNNGWQHAQLFRQDLYSDSNDNGHPPKQFHLKIFFD